MKFYTIALFIFILNISMSLINVTDVFYTKISEVKEITEYQDNIQNDDYFQNSAQIGSISDLNYGDFAQGFSLFIEFIFGVIWIPATLNNLGLEPSITIPIALMLYLIYTIGLLQYISNRQLKTMS